MDRVVKCRNFSYLLKGDSITFHHRGMILPAIFETLLTLTEILCSGVSLQYSYTWVDCTVELLECRPKTFGKKDQFCKDFFEIFDTLEHFFLSEDFKKIIYSGVFSLVPGIRQDSCNCNKRKHQYIRFSGLFPTFLVQLF